MILQNGIKITCFGLGITVNLDGYEYDVEGPELKQLMGEVDAILDENGMKKRTTVPGGDAKRGINIMEQKLPDRSYIYACDDTKRTEKAFQVLCEKLEACGI